jgi:CRP/FNR family transcriptional regulator, cyclic AMP receptor protein
MGIDTKVQALSNVPLFSGCTKRELKAIARLCTDLDVPAGSVLTTEGVPGRECFIVADGEARVVIGKRTVAAVGPGDIVGEMSLLDGGPRSATVTATTPMALYALSVPEFNALLDTSQSTSHRIMVSLARRLRQAETKRPH